MSLDYTHKPNYFMFAQLFIRHLHNYFEKILTHKMQFLTCVIFTNYFAKTKHLPPLI